MNAAVRADNAVVMLNSIGGSTFAGIEIGKAIRLKNFATVVPEGFMCASACGLAWLGGVRRFMSGKARVGFHATYETQGGQPEVSSVGNAAVGAYLSQLGLPLSAIAYISEAKPSEMQWLTFADARSVGIEVEPFEIAANASPPQPETSGGPSRPDWASQGDWIQIYSRSNATDAIALAADVGKQFGDTSVFRYDNGWYVVVLGPYASGTGRSLLDRYLATGSIPNDSLLSSGKRFVERIWPSGTNATNDPAAEAMNAARTFFEQTSGPSPSALDFLDRLYAPQVTYYGKTMPKSDVMAQKKAFVERWPERTYTTLPGTLKAQCNPGGDCSVTGMITFRAYSPTRHQTSFGTASFALVFAGPDGSQLISENGAVLARDKHSGK